MVGHYMRNFYVPQCTCLKMWREGRIFFAVVTLLVCQLCCFQWLSGRLRSTEISTGPVIVLIVAAAVVTAARRLHHNRSCREATDRLTAARATRCFSSFSTSPNFTELTVPPSVYTCI